MSDKDYVDDESGEIVLEKGRAAKTSTFHSSYVRTSRAYRYDDDLEVDPAEAFDDAVKEFASNFKDSFLDDGEIPDAAEGFFHSCPQWQEWADELGMSRADIKSMVIDFIYTAMA